ncbi:MAG: hypothetical protein ACLFWL_13160 [Candidatus Brocadiia bacterium]
MTVVFMLTLVVCVTVPGLAGEDEVARLKKKIENLKARIDTLEKQLEGTAKPVNLARTTLARVKGSSVNGARPLDDPYYGVLNAFDDGQNFMDGVNYSYWLSGRENAPWVELRFSKPVVLTEIQVEGGPPFEPRLYMARGGESNRKKVEKKIHFENPVRGVSGIRLTFEGKGTTRVEEIRVFGFPPPGADYETRRPNVIPTRHSAMLSAREAFQTWQQEIWAGVHSKIREAPGAFIITFRRQGLDVFEVVVNKETGKARAQPLVRLAPREQKGPRKNRPEDQGPL